MWKNSDELMELARKEIKTAIAKEESEVEIILSNDFSNDTNQVREYCATLQLKNITETLRQEFSNYNIRSIVKSKRNLSSILTLKNAPCKLFYPLVWCLTLQEK